ncbi:DUF4876 domain-containing protein [uncultured Sanguibacteroides sp.]|uniref:DUF4876 domain-containing protein n=1 Tax=uncultured Sanguibacteroides sp. TaxID=1635151 RepID=UPI0025F2A194|nr:DUF4876 domain-containing protein [uncultured Sanguibacteroides sp.]
MKRFAYLLLVIGCVCGLFSCDDENKVKITNYTLNLSTPDSLKEATLSDITTTFENVNSGKKSTESSCINNQVTIDLPEGLYHITVEGKIHYTWEGKQLTSTIKGYKESVSVVGETMNSNIPLFLYSSNADFVISEIFFAGTQTAEGKQYYGDQYIKIYNNSDKILYADGLAIVSSEFSNNYKQDISPDIRSTGFAINSLVIIPGNGNEHPVQPGESLIIATDAIDHRQATANSFDLRKADFELYLDGSYEGDIDNPEVPNMINIYNFLIINNQGNQTYALVRLPVSTENFLKNNKYDYKWTFVYPGGTLVNDESCYQVPNHWIVDAVNLCPSKEYEWLVTAPSVDMGYAFVTENASSNDRYGKSIRRKIEKKSSNGQEILQDTNNSNVDFIHGAIPSLKK